MAVTVILVFILGTVIGSFLNVCIYRMPKNESIIFPSSHCPSCKKNIHWYDNIPLLSYAALCGKCRFCGVKIPFRYPLVEIITGLLMTALFLRFGLTPKFAAYFIMSCGLIVSTFIDFEIQEIPDEISLGGLILGVVLSSAFPSIMDRTTHMSGFIYSVSGAAAGSGAIFLLGFLGKMVFKKEAMGGGDVKLMAMIGSIIGLKMVILVFFLAPFLGVIPGIVSKVRKGAETIPYGPFLSAAAIISVFFGNKILAFLFGGML